MKLKKCQESKAQLDEFLKRNLEEIEVLNKLVLLQGDYIEIQKHVNFTFYPHLIITLVEIKENALMIQIFLKVLNIVMMVIKQFIVMI
jgi:hypothetical protein